MTIVQRMLGGYRVALDRGGKWGVPFKTKSPGDQPGPFNILPREGGFITEPAGLTCCGSVKTHNLPGAYVR